MHPDRFDKESQFNAFVVDVIDKALANQGSHPETHRVEFKFDITTSDKKKMAMQLGGMANAANGADIALIFGFDDRDKKFTDPNIPELAVLGQKLASCFDDVSPFAKFYRSYEVANGNHVYAFCFETGNAPYVVKIDSGKNDVPYRETQETDKEVDKSEKPHTTTHRVPMRHLTGTRSATRVELLRMLAPTIQTPIIRVIKSQLNPSNITQLGKISLFYCLRLIFIVSTKTPLTLLMNNSKFRLSVPKLQHTEEDLVQLRPNRQIEYDQFAHRIDGAITLCLEHRISISNRSLEDFGVIQYELNLEYLELGKFIIYGKYNTSDSGSTIHDARKIN